MNDNTQDPTQATANTNIATDSSATSGAAQDAMNTDSVNNLRMMIAQVNKALIGQERVVKHVVLALLSNGHVLLEGVPGLGKTLLVRALSKTFSGDFKRIQFTPDLMPSDVTGHVVFDMENKSFQMNRGPVFTNLLLADEINRAPAKSQAALLEVMQEKQVTTEGESRKVPLPFMVLATQNPLEQEGTYPLPEAELDRFLVKVVIDFPSIDNEVKLTKLITQGQVGDNSSIESIKPVLTANELLAYQQQVANVEVDDQVVDYAVRIVRATRSHPAIFRGAGSRASIGLVRIAKANAFLAGRQFVLPDDVKSMAVAVLQHRVALTPDVEIEGLSAPDVLNQMLMDIEAPRQ
ncbi:AAA family ATPase [Arenicella xantha]|uniref:MoxR-like ATPase n=1 Tax=Arenicella xantha TaxID=644221 RepID=A0A395JI84_9GAMM|nr:MoxR family ATPase [Arenicella xantha]RBP48306.1 MoxR-like ATPase [Arenicella xantha]